MSRRSAVWRASPWYLGVTARQLRSRPRVRGSPRSRVVVASRQSGRGFFAQGLCFLGRCCAAVYGAGYHPNGVGNAETAGIAGAQWRPAVRQTSQQLQSATLHGTQCFDRCLRNRRAVNGHRGADGFFRLHQALAPLEVFLTRRVFTGPNNCSCGYLVVRGFRGPIVPTAMVNPIGIMLRFQKVRLTQVPTK